MIKSPLTPEGVARSFEVVPITFCNILPQPRKTFVEKRLKKLGKGIENDGLIHPITVALYSEEKVGGFLEYVNYLWRRTIEITDLTKIPSNLEGLEKQAENKHFKEFVDRFAGKICVILAGERRTRSVRDYTDFDIIESFVFHNPPPQYALRLQINENSHQQVPPEEQAETYRRLHRLLVDLENRDITLRDFASLVCRSPDTVRKALRYAGMAEVFKDMVEQGLLSYGHVLELRRMKEAGYNQSQLRTYAGLAATGWDDTSDAGLTVSEFREVVDTQIEDKENNQQTLFTDDPQEADERNRKVAAKKWVYLANAAENYFQELIDLIDAGVLGEMDAEFSPGSPRRRVIGMLDSLQTVVDGLGEEGFTQKEINSLRGQIRRIRAELTTRTNEKPQG